MSKLKLLTIRDAEKSDDSQLFILNRINPRGNVNITVTMDGERRTATFPIASIPVDATTMVTKKSLLNSPEFRRLHARGFLQIVDTDSAEALFKTDKKALDELNRVMGNIGTGELVESVSLSNEVERLNTSNDLPVGVSPFVMAIVERARSDESPNALINELEAQLDILTINELEYLVSQSTTSQIKEWAAEILQLKSAEQ